MQEMLDDVLKAEETGEKIVNDAREEAARMRSNLESQLSAALKNAREESQTIIHKAVQDARKEASRLFEEAVQKAQAASEEFSVLHQEQLDRIVKEVVRLIAVPEYKRK